MVIPVQPDLSPAQFRLVYTNPLLNPESYVWARRGGGRPVLASTAPALAQGLYYRRCRVFLSGEWGRVIVIPIGIGLGVLYSNARLNDKFNDLKSYVDARFSATDKRLDDIKDFIRSEIRGTAPIGRAG